MIPEKIPLVGVGCIVIRDGQLLLVRNQRMRGDAGGASPGISDPAEIKELGWFRPNEFPTPLQLYFQNLLEGRCWPRTASIFQE